MENYDLDNFTPAARIVVIGVGGAGNNAVNRMIDEEITNVEFYVANTDKQALSTSKSSNRIILGDAITGGLGAGGEPEVGEQAAEASANEIREIVTGANMVFIAAGMGGGTGTGAAPVIAKIAKDAGALTVAIVTRPFTFEGKKRNANSIDGLNKLAACVDSMIVVSNDKLLMTAGNASVSDAFASSDKVLAQSVKTIVNLILIPAVINRDFADVRRTLENSGVALIGFGMGSGPNKAKEAAENAMNCPLLEASITGARRAIIVVTCGTGVSLYDAQETVNLLIDASGRDVDVKFGVAINDQLNDEILVSIIASDFENKVDFSQPTQFVAPKPVDNSSLGGLFNSAPPTNNTNTNSESEATKDNESDLDEDNILPDFLKD